MAGVFLWQLWMNESWMRMWVSYDCSKWIFFHREIKIKPEPVFVKFMEPRNRFRGIDSASLCSLAGRYDKYGCPTGLAGWDRFLSSLKDLQIRAQFKFIHFVDLIKDPFLSWNWDVSASQNIGCTYVPPPTLLHLRDEWRVEGLLPATTLIKKTQFCSEIWKGLGAKSCMIFSC